MNQKQLRELGRSIEIYKRLQKIAKTIHTLDENSCNYELSKAQETRLENLVAKAWELAELIDLKAYHQPDPRGCSLYLITKDMDYTNYNQGIEIY